MLSEKIKTLRKKNNLSQEELAVRLNVVRQTVSKWENDLSVPDADQLIKLADVLNTTVNELLEITDKEKVENVAKELEKVNRILAEKIEKERLNNRINRIRGQILSLTFLSLIFALTMNQQIISLILMTICVIGALIILYRNATLLMSAYSDEGNVRSVKITTVFNMILIGICCSFAVAIASDTIKIPDDHGQYFASLIVIIVMLFGGFISPKLTFNRHTGLRLPWTVTDEDTWNLAHRIIGIISVPLAMVYLTGVAAKLNFEILTLVIMILWIGIPSVISFTFYYRKYKKI